MSQALWLKASLVVVALLVVIQAVPYGREHHNPPVRKEPAWANARTRELARRACFDCHSNETTWPWYANVAPISWIVTHDVNEGREHLNFSEWDHPQKHADDAADAVREREMPMLIYLPAHPEARLTDAERDELVKGLAQSFGDNPGDEHGHEH